MLATSTRLKHKSDKATIVKQGTYDGYNGIEFSSSRLYSRAKFDMVK
ncbi:hypothetical protein WG66_012821 [Moniliophthora roreri]|nr:hypothetical protein WG66_012821 [Moniliophthora roreri]